MRFKMRANRLTRISYQERKKSRNLHPDLIQRPPNPHPTRPRPRPRPPASAVFSEFLFLQVGCFLFWTSGRVSFNFCRGRFFTSFISINVSSAQVQDTQRFTGAESKLWDFLLGKTRTGSQSDFGIRTFLDLFWKDFQELHELLWAKPVNIREDTQLV